MSQAVNTHRAQPFIPAHAMVDEEATSPVNTGISPSATTVVGETPVSPYFDGRSSVSPCPSAAAAAKPISLLEATVIGNLRIVTSLLRQKADIDQQDLNGDTALHLAATRVDGAAMATLLLHSGAMLKVNNDGKRASEIAAANGFSEVLEVFAKAEVEFQPVKVFQCNGEPEYSLVEKRRSPLNGRVTLLCRDANSKIVKFYEHIKSEGKLPSGGYKVCKSSLEDGALPTARLVMRTKGYKPETVQMLHEQVDNLATLFQKVGPQRGLALSDLIIVNKSQKDDSESIDFYQKLYDLGDLHNVYKVRRNLRGSEKFSIAKDLLHGLAAMHGKGVAHCDIKPANCLVRLKSDKTLGAALSDFDLCVHANSKIKLCGTYIYLSPEIAFQLWSRQKETFAARQTGDVWALGLVLYLIDQNWKYPVSLQRNGIEVRGKENVYIASLANAFKAGIDADVFPKPSEAGFLNIVWQMLQLKVEKRITAEDALKQFELLYPEKIPSLADTASSAAAAAGSSSNVAQAPMGDEKKEPTKAVK